MTALEQKETLGKITSEEARLILIRETGYRSESFDESLEWVFLRHDGFLHEIKASLQVEKYALALIVQFAAEMLEDQLGVLRDASLFVVDIDSELASIVENLQKICAKAEKAQVRYDFDDKKGRCSNSDPCSTKGV